MSTEEEAEEMSERQEEVVDSFMTGIIFTCPSCGEGVVGFPMVENPGEDNTQIYCDYGCGYIFLEEFLNKKQNRLC